MSSALDAQATRRREREATLPHSLLEHANLPERATAQRTQPEGAKAAAAPATGSASSLALQSLW